MQKRKSWKAEDPAGHGPRPIRALSFAFSDCDHFAELLQHDDAEIIQIRPGTYTNRLLLAPLDRTVLRYGVRSTPWLSTGGALRGHVSILLDLNYPKPLLVNGRLKEGDSTLDIYGAGSEHCAVALDPGEYAYVPFPTDMVEAACRAAGLDGAPVREGQSLRLTPDRPSFTALRETIASIHRLGERQPDGFANADFRRSMERSLLTALALVTANHSPPAAPLPAAEAMGILRRAQSYLRDRIHEPVYILDLCAAVGTHERTLRSIFMMHYGMSPLRFLKLQRLREVRRVLRSSDPAATSVKAVALTYGFWEIGRFAVEYRQFFGERPSATLTRSCPTPYAAATGEDQGWWPPPTTTPAGTGATWKDDQ